MMYLDDETYHFYVDSFFDVSMMMLKKVFNIYAGQNIYGVVVGGILWPLNIICIVGIKEKRAHSYKLFKNLKYLLYKKLLLFCL